MDLVAVLALCRLLHDAAAILLWGAFGYLWLLVPRPLAGGVAPRLEALRVVAVGIAVATALVTLPLEAARVGNGWQDAANPAVLGLLLATTSVGRAWQIGMGAALVAFATLFAPARLRVPAAAIAGGLLLASLSFGGHAVIGEGWLGPAHRINDALHVLASGAWLGALVPLVLVLAAIGRPGCHDDAMVALDRFSVAGHLAVALTILTGLVNTLLIVGHLPNPFASPYQAMLSAKIVFVLGMVGLAITNRYRFMPKLAAGKAAGAAAIRKGAVAELVVAAAVLALVAVFGLLDPM